MPDFEVIARRTQELTYNIEADDEAHAIRQVSQGWEDLIPVSTWDQDFEVREAYEVEPWPII